jgi:hypothetical protein
MADPSKVYLRNGLPVHELSGGQSVFGYLAAEHVLVVSCGHLPSSFKLPHGIAMEGSPNSLKTHGCDRYFSGIEAAYLSQFPGLR